MARKMFSISFVASAARADETRTVRAMTSPYRSSASSPASGSVPPTTLGMVVVPYFGLPGSSRSGENARKKSLPALRPEDSRISRTRPSVVPGYVVDSRTMSCPGRSADAMASQVLRTYRISGSRWGVSGVGTQIRIASGSERRKKSSVAVNRPLPTSAASLPPSRWAM